MNFGFSYVGLVYIVILMIPNLIWAKNKPVDYDKYVKNESKVLLFFERMGEILVTAAALVFADFNLQAWNLWELWLCASFILMLLYELYWIRYFKSPRNLKDQYSSFCGVPLAGASLPVAAFLLLGFYGKNLIMIVSVVLLGIGHIGIHLAHYAETRQLESKDGQFVKEKEPSKLTRFLYLFVQFTWGLGQTIIGFLFFLIHIARPHRIYRCAIETKWKKRYAGLSLGPFIFVPDNEGDYFTGARVHEYGHTIQSLIMGPLYAIVGVISVGWGSILFPILKGTKKYKDLLYTKCFIEYWASWLGEKATGEKAAW